MKTTSQTVASFYNNHVTSERKPYEDRAVRHAEVTIPYLFTDDRKTNKKSAVFQSKQSIGSKGVNSLASKLLLTQFPANTPFFRFDYPEEEINEIIEQAIQQGANPDEAKQAKIKIDKELSHFEQIITEEVELQAMRPVLNSALKQLIVTGNVLLYLPKEGGIRMYRLHNYAVLRDHTGQPYRIIVEDKISYHTMSKDLKEEADLTNLQDNKKDDPISVYTDIQWNADKKKWIVRQEINEKNIKSAEGSYPKDRLPFIPLRFIRMDGEHYGRAYVEEYYGDLVSVSDLRGAITDASKASAKLLVMVRNNSFTKKKDVAQAPNGAVVTGDANDVSFLQVGKHADLSVAERTSETIKQDLRDAFLMKNTRQAERVTREEIRQDALELEGGLGGVYSTLSHEMQLPIVTILMHRLTKKSNFKFLPVDVIKPKIITGIEALGRGNDLKKLRVFLGSVTEVLGAEAVNSVLKTDAVLTLFGNAIGVKTDEIVKSPEEIAMEQQQAAQEQLAMQTAQQAIPAVLQQGQQPQEGNE